MRIVETVDYGDSPTYFVTGTSSVSLASPNVVEVTLYRAVESDDGTIENRVQARILYDRAVWLAAMTLEMHARELIRDQAAMPRLVAAARAH